MVNLFKQGKYTKVPTIWGSCAQEPQMVGTFVYLPCLKRLTMLSVKSSPSMPGL
ncbi:hypothetical protein CTA2_3926, partial [Colletotrichum tanaceti]